MCVSSKAEKLLTKEVGSNLNDFPVTLHQSNSNLRLEFPLQTDQMTAIKDQRK